MLIETCSTFVYVATVIHKQVKLEILKIHACIPRKAVLSAFCKLIDHYMCCLTQHDVLPYVQNLWYATGFIRKQLAMVVQLQQTQCNIPVEQIIRH